MNLLTRTSQIHPFALTALLSTAPLACGGGESEVEDTTNPSSSSSSSGDTTGTNGTSAGTDSTAEDETGDTNASEATTSGDGDAESTADTGDGDGDGDGDATSGESSGDGDGDGDCADDADAARTATPISPMPDNQNGLLGNLCGSDEQDWYVYTLNAPGFVAAEVRFEAGQDLDLYILDEQLGFVSSSTGGGQQETVHESSPAGTYYIRIDRVSEVADYDVSLQVF